MESVLNIAWVLVSALVLVAGVAHHRARERRRQSLLMVVLALLSIALLAFPSISLSDDLHPVIFSSESISKRSVTSSISHISCPPNPELDAVHRLAEPNLADSGVEVVPVRLESELSAFALKVSGRDPPQSV